MIKSIYKYFTSNKESESIISLLEVLEKNELSADDILDIVIEIANKIENYNNDGNIVGSINIDEIYLCRETFNICKLDLKRRLLKLNDNYINYEEGRLVPPEIHNKNSKLLSFSADVYLVGRIMLEIILYNNIQSNSYMMENILAYNYRGFTDKLPIELQYIFLKSINMNSNERYSSVKDFKSDLDKVKLIEKKRLSNSKKKNNIKCNIRTDIGRGKLKNNITAGKSLVYANEDSSLVVRIDENRMFFMVADGISNCSYGTGYEASKILKKVCKYYCKTEGYKLTNSDEISEFIQKIVNTTNYEIYKYLEDELENITFSEFINSRGVMGSTFVGGLIIGGVLYYFSIGDSRIYLISNEKFISQITIDEKTGIKILLEDKSLYKYERENEKNTLANYIGGLDVDEDKYKLRKVAFNINMLNLLDGDNLIICSDGLTDCLGNSFFDKNDWGVMNLLREAFIKNDSCDISEINNKLVTLANDNGGNDNITSIIIRISN